MKKIFKIKTFIPVLALAAFMISSCGNGNNTEKKEETEAEAPKEDPNTVELTGAQYKTSGIQLGAIEKKAISGVLKVNGFVDVPPENLVSVTTQMGGIVKNTPLLQGSNVSKGQVIAVLQNQEYVQLQQDYLESRSQLEFATSEYQRQVELSKQNVNAQKVLQQAKSQYQTMLARTSALRARLQLININASSLNAGNIRSTINIYSPISGYVTKVNVNAGRFVTPNDVMFEIVNGANLHIELKVFEQDVNKVTKGQTVRFTLPNETDERTAKVLLVGKEINADKTVTVHCIASFQSKNLLPNTYIKALIETGSETVTALPESAVVDFEGKKFIFFQTSENEAEKKAEKAEGAEKEEGYHFQLVEVSIGASDGGYVHVELPGGIDIANAKVVTSGAYDLISKLKNAEEEE